MGGLPETSYAHEDQQRPFAEVIAILTATRRPEDAYKVYQILDGCDAFRAQFDAESTALTLLPLKKRCASITDVMRRSKNDYLVTATSAGVPGTAVAWLERGPLGAPQMLREKPDDPLVKEWKNQASAMLIRDGEQGYIDALSRLMQGYSKSNPLFNVDPGKALAYATAYKMILDDLKLDLPDRPTEQDLNALAANLSVEQVAWAKARAAAIVSARRKRQLDQG